MSSKKSSKNGFMKYCFTQQRNDPSLSGLSTEELVAKCSPRWAQMSSSQKSHFKESGQALVSRRPLEGDNSVEAFGPLDSFGRSLFKMEKSRKEEDLRLEEMKLNIQQKIELAVSNHDLEDQIFYLMSTNIFCFTAEKQIVPAELSITKISLRRGVINTFHVFIEPGTIPKGYRSDCLANSKATHKIPLDFHQFEGDYRKILEDIVEFLISEGESELPPIYCMPKLVNQNKLVLEWILKKSKSDIIDKDMINMFSLPCLLYELTREHHRSQNVDSSFSSLSSLGVVKNRVPCLTIAEAQLDRDTFMFMPGMACDWHQEQETLHCSKSVVIGWSYILFSLVNPLLGVPMNSVSHMPLGEEKSFSAESYRSSLARGSSCRLSTISGDNTSIRSGSIVEQIHGSTGRLNMQRRSYNNNLVKQSSELFGDHVETSVSTDQSFV